MNTYGYLFWGYTIFWLALSAYLLWVVRRVLGAGRRLDELERRQDPSKRA